MKSERGKKPHKKENIMIETYKQFKRVVNDNYLTKTNEELAEIFKGAKSEYERSQSIASLFVKNFPAALGVSNKYKHIESSEKAGLITMELLKTLEDYNGSTLFITYYRTRIENLFLWDYGKKKKEIKALQSSVSINSSAGDNDYVFQVEDNKPSKRLRTIEFFNDVERMFKEEEKYWEGTKKETRMKKNIAFLEEVFGVLKDNPDFCASQVARVLGLFVKDKETGEFKYWINKTSPDYIRQEKLTESGEVVKNKFGKTQYTVKEVSRVREAQWYKVQKAVREIRELLQLYEVV